MDDIRFNCASYFSRKLMTAFSPSGPRARLSILIYHRVLPQPDPLFPSEVDAIAFDRQMALLKACFNIIRLDEAIERLRRGNLPSRAACITFDDGYADNAEIALPILQKYNIPATFFIAAGFLNGGRMWNDSIIELVRRTPAERLDLTSIGLGSYEIRTLQEKQYAIQALLEKLKYLPLETRLMEVDRVRNVEPVALPDNLMMRSDQVRKLHDAGMEIGGHTVNHPILARMDPEAAREEIACGKEALEAIIHTPVRFFAYPNGRPHQDYIADHVEIVKRLGFRGAVSTAWGAARADDDLFQLPRFTPWDVSRTRFIMRMAQNMFRKPDLV